MFLAALAINSPVELDLPVTHLAAISINLALLGGLFGTLALLVGAIVGRRSIVIGATTVVAVVAFLMNGLAPQVEAIAWLQNVSPFHGFAGIATLRDGADLGLTGLLVASITVFVLASVWAFSRRDVGVGS